MKKGLLKYILAGVGAAALFLVFFAFVGPMLNPEKAFADGFRSILDWVLALAFGFSCAYSYWKKNNGDDSKK